jgi:hypothetical protein
MLISHHRLIFVHIPKCAGRSIAHAFGLDFSHHTVHEYSQPEYQQILRFAVVRNTWDRLVSMYHYLRDCPWHRQSPVLGRHGVETSFRSWLIDNLNARRPDFTSRDPCGRRETDNELGSPFWFSSQLAWIGRPEGQVYVDRLLRFSTLQPDFARLCRELGLKLRLPHKNRSPWRRKYRDYYDHELRQLVARHYASDIERFRFTF